MNFSISSICFAILLLLSFVLSSNSSSSDRIIRNMSAMTRKLQEIFDSHEYYGLEFEPEKKNKIFCRLAEIRLALDDIPFLESIESEGLNAISLITTFYKSDLDNAGNLKFLPIFEEIVHDTHDALFKPETILMHSRNRLTLSQFEKSSYFTILSLIMSSDYPSILSQDYIKLACLVIFIASLIFTPFLTQFLGETLKTSSSSSYNYKHLLFERIPFSDKRYVTVMSKYIVPLYWIVSLLSLAPITYIDLLFIKLCLKRFLEALLAIIHFYAINEVLSNQKFRLD